MMGRTAARTLASAIFLCLLLVSVVAEDKVCPEEARKLACDAKDVILLDGVPDASGIDTTQQKTVSLLQEEPARFAKVSRISQTTIPPGWVHVSANGDHEGWFVRLPSQSPCHIQMAMRLVAREIVALHDYSKEKSSTVREVDLRGPYRLVDDEGRAFPDQATSNRLHLLLPREAFVHASVKEGFVRTLSDGKTNLTTLSLSPRVFLVDPILSKEDCEELIEIGSNGLRRSSEKHYSDAYKDYRTSLSGATPQNARVTRLLRQRVKNITAMPDGGVEAPSLLMYHPGTSWYKKHHDFYHNHESRPLEEVRMFVQTRARELLHVSKDISNVLGDGSSLDSFDPLTQPLNTKIAKTLAVGLVTEEEDGTDRNWRRLLHDYLVNAEAPVQVFQDAAVLYASELLRAAGADNPGPLAEQYFQLEGIANPEDTTGVFPMYCLEDYVPFVVKPIQSNRHATVLPVLRHADRGGNTAFPEAISNNMGVQPDHDEEFEECKKGLLVKAQGGQALLFYNRSPRGELDYSSRHAGCPPKEGEKYAVNCFTWDGDRYWAFKFLTEIEHLYRN